MNTSQLTEHQQDRPIIIGGMIAKIRTHITQRGRNAGSKMAVFVLEDLQGTVEVVLFSKILEKYSFLLETDNVVFVKGRLDYRRERPNVIAEEVIALKDVIEKLATKVRIRLNADNVTRETVVSIKSICSHHKGKSPVYVAVTTNKGKVHTAAGKEYRVNPDLEFCRKMKKLVGEENFQLAQT
jgi:DNA polymerase-3 subunit alpha